MNKEGVLPLSSLCKYAESQTMDCGLQVTGIRLQQFADRSNRMYHVDPTKRPKAIVRRWPHHDGTDVPSANL